MSDNYETNVGAGGNTYASDDIAGIHHPRVKVQWGADGVATDVDTGADALPVQGEVSITGSVAVTGPLTDTQLRASAVPVSAATLPLPTGAATAANQATEIAGLSSIDGHVDGVETLLAGGLPAALGAGGGLKVDGSGTALPVSAASLPLPTGASTEATLALIKAKTDNIDVALSTRTKPADQQHVIVDSGSITANAGADLNTSALALETGGNLAAAATSLGVIDDWDESDRAKVNPIVGQAGVQGGSGTVSATTQRMCLATDVALPAGTAVLGATRGVMGKKYDASGNSWTVKNAKLRTSTTGTDVVALVSSKKLRIISYLVQSAGTVTFNFADTDGTALSPVLDFQAREGATRTAPDGTWLFETSSGKGIEVTLSGAINVSVEITYLEED